MSQFGTIGTPRMHPCVSHPSCSQFNATDIILASEGIPRTSQRNTSKFDYYGSMDSRKDGQNDNKLSSIEMNGMMEQTKTDIQGKECHFQNGNHFAGEGNRRYVEVSPGVWSYMG